MLITGKEGILARVDDYMETKGIGMGSEPNHGYVVWEVDPVGTCGMGSGLNHGYVVWEVDPVGTCGMESGLNHGYVVWEVDPVGMWYGKWTLWYKA